MTKQKLFKHIMPILLSAMLLFSALPMSASANDESTNEVASKIVREVVELREESVKHFLCEDGSYIAVSYAEPVHYEKNGEWLEIDNTLVLSSENTYVPKSSDLAVSIPKSFSGGKQITATNNGRTISFGVASGNENVALSKTAAVKAVEALPSSIAADVSVEALAGAELSSKAAVGKVNAAAQIEAYNSEKTTVENQAGALVYDKIFPNADLEYIVTGSSIKENVVVYQPQTEYVYTFDMDFGGLTPIAEEDGSITLVDSAKQNKVMFVIAAPYMYDANGEESYNVEMSLTENGDNYLLTLVADETWLNNSEREFPVVIDPTVYYQFDDVFVMNGIYANSPRVKNKLRVGRNLTNLSRTYIKISESHNIPYGSTINSAKLILTNKNYYQAPLQDNISVKLYDCYNIAAWSATSVTWNNQPFGNTAGSYSSYGANLLSEIQATNNEGSKYEFNIKPAVENWLETGINKGFMLASSDESSKTQIDFYSSRADVYKPIVHVNYNIPHLSSTEWVPDKNASTSPAITVIATKNWTASANQPWISVSPSSGAGKNSFTISVTENPNASARQGEVSVMIGTTEIGKVTVTQTGSDPFLSVNKTNLNYKHDETDITQVVIVNANEGWSFGSDEESWLSVDKTADNELTFELLEANETNETRSSTVTVTTASGLSEEITVTQLDEVSSYFNQFNPDGSVSIKSSSEYNHPLATWAMALSYAAYNPVEYALIPIVPSSFMQEPYDDETRTAEFELESMGFDATAYNYDGGYSGYAAHTIGHREITINNNNIITGGNNNANNGNVAAVATSVSWGATHLSVSETDSREILRTNFQSGEIASEIDETISETTNNSRTLVVISIRGSVTPLDWAMDLASQFDLEGENFEAGCQEIITSLNNYLSDNEDSIAGEPIILVTGHSLGAAVANLVANELNAGTSSADVYAYTFATPNTVNIASGDQPEAYTNVFNILNNNDAVPHFPMDILGTEWARHGQDFHITMPLNVDWIFGVDVSLLGVAGHGMPNYYSWMNNLPGTLGKPAEDISVYDLNAMSVDYAVGLVAKILKVLCPVSVTLYDANGNIVAYESQQKGITYPEITDTGIVSWIAEDGGKMFLIPYGTEDIEARIKAYDYGTMTLTVEQPGIGEPLDTITYNNVNLYPDKEFKVEIAESFDSDEVALMQVETDENGNEIETEITDLNPLLKSVTVQNPVVNYGTPTVIEVVTDKSITKVRFIHSTNGATITIDKTSDLVVSIVEDGDNLIWTIQRVFTTGNLVYDVALKIGNTWYPPTERVFALTVT